MSKDTDLHQSSKSERINSGLFKEETRRAFPQEALNVLEAFENASFNFNRKTHDVWKSDGEFFIQTYEGPQTLKGYIFQLENAAIVLQRKLSAHKEVNRRLHEQLDSYKFRTLSRFIKGKFNIFVYKIKNWRS